MAGKVLFMCLINFQFQRDAEYPFVLAANRDEFFTRPTRQAHFWKDEPGVLAGRDLEKLGTWLGITKSGRFAALTNFRDPAEKADGKKSRGELVRSFLSGTASPEWFMKELQKERTSYPGFNLLAGTIDELWCYNNRTDDLRKVSPGTHSLSNACLNSPWPKSEKGKASLDNCLQHDRENLSACLFSFLQDRQQAKDKDLPATGVPLEKERVLSSIFIEDHENDYGTRCSTVLLIDRQQNVYFAERTYLHGQLAGEEVFQFAIEREKDTAE